MRCESCSNYDNFNTVSVIIHIENLNNVDGSTDLLQSLPERKKETSKKHDDLPITININNNIQNPQHIIPQPNIQQFVPITDPIIRNQRIPLGYIQKAYHTEDNTKGGDYTLINLKPTLSSENNLDSTSGNINDDNINSNVLGGDNDSNIFNSTEISENKIE